MGALDRVFSRLAAAACLVAVLAAPLHATTITIVNLDGPDEGFNDTTPAAPVGGNPGTTVGEQRLAVFQHAAEIWAGILVSNIEIRVNAQMNAQTCDATTGVLGSAGAANIYRDFANAPVAAHWYPVALANRLANTDINPAANDINATFNSSIGQETCLPMGWYYGFDGNEGNAIALLPVVLHELGHGLGFSTTTNGQTGNYSSSFPHIWDRFLTDNVLALHWDQMSAAQRSTSAKGCTRLVWGGSYAQSHALTLMNPKPLVHVSAPEGIVGDYDVGLADFGPSVGNPTVTGNVVLAQDGAGASPTDGCEALTNAAAIAGNIALIDRGTCLFVEKVKIAQDAGAIGVIIADNVAGCPDGLGGEDATITIPAVRITQANGNTIKNNLGLGVVASITRDATKQAGCDGQGRVRMYTPTTFSSGSSVSHWDVTADPNLLMEPAITASINDDVDLARWVFADIGWFQGLTDVPNGQSLISRLDGASPNPFRARASTTIRFTLDRAQPVDLAIYDLAGRLVSTLRHGVTTAGEHAIEWNGRDRSGHAAAPGIYLYRLVAGGTVESKHVVLMQ